MDDLISRQEAIDAHYEYCNKHPDAGFPVWSLKILEDLPSAQPETCGDVVSRNAIIQKLNTMDRYVSEELRLCDTDKKFPQNEVFIVDDVYEEIVEQLPPAQPETHEERTETHACDYISRQAAMEEISKQQTYKMFEGEDTLYLDANDVGSVLASLPSAQPDSKETSSTHKALDTISRQDAIDAVQKLRDAEVRQYGKVPCKGYWELTAAMNAVRCVPSAQPEIIWCKDCKHWFDIDDGRQKHRMCADVYGDWFCADAERRTDE